MHPGHEATYAIWVWSTEGTSHGVSVRIALSNVRHVTSPHFTVCRTANGRTCGIGALAKGQADELEAAAKVGKAARAGEVLDLTALASGSNASSYSAGGSIAVVTAASPSASASIPTAPEPTVTVTLPGVSEPEGTHQGDGAGGLFPTISPSPSSSSSGIGFPSAHARGSHAGRHRTRVADAASVVPLDSRLLGGQIIGLAVLALAFAIAVARLSLRRPRTQSGPADAAKKD